MKAARDVRSAAVVINAGSRRGAAPDLAVDAMRKAGVPISSVHHVLSGAEGSLAVGRLTGCLRTGTTWWLSAAATGRSYAAGRVAGTNVVLGVLPLGTANDFARTLEIRQQSCRGVRYHRRREGGGHRPRPGQRRAIPQRRVRGCRVSVTEALSPRLKRYIGPLAYSDRHADGIMPGTRRSGSSLPCSSPTGTTSRWSSTTSRSSPCRMGTRPGPAGGVQPGVGRSPLCRAGPGTYPNASVSGRADPQQRSRACRRGRPLAAHTAGISAAGNHTVSGGTERGSTSTISPAADIYSQPEPGPHREPCSRG